SREWSTRVHIVLALAIASIFGVLMLGAGTAGAAPGTKSPSAKPPKSAGSTGTCGASDASIPSPKAKAFKSKTLSAAGDPLFDITKFWADKAKEVAGKKVLELGWQLANKLISGDRNQEILDKLDQVNTRLDDISSRLDNLTNTVTRLQADFNRTDFESKMAEICSFVIDQQNLYRFHYVPMIYAAVFLGDNLGSADTPVTNCRFPDPVLNRCLTPRELATRAQNEFVEFYKGNEDVLLKGITTIHNALMPGSPSGSVLAARGRVLMASRYVTRAQSADLQDLYSDLHETEALAS
ncbi:MAG: hypothetical protein ACRD1T_28115, partial [Acidimicrobiia bacterium]